MNTRKTKLENLSLIMLFCLASLSGCLLRVTETPMVQKSPPPTKTVYPTISPTQTPNSPQLPTETPASVLKKFHFEEQCLQVIDGEPPDLSGKALLDPVSAATDKTTYLFDLQSGNRLPIGKLITVYPSPNGCYLAYHDWDQDMLVMYDVLEEKSTTMPVSIVNWDLEGWLDDQTLQFVSMYKGSVLDVPFYIGSMALLNPFTGEQEEWQPNYPGFDWYYNSAYWGETRQIINKARTYLIYPSSEAGLPAILWDLNSQREVARVYRGNRLSQPKWAPDDQRFVISAPLELKGEGKVYQNSANETSYTGEELFIVSTNGKVERLTYFSDYNIIAWPSLYAWSPDGNRIAFLLSTESPNNPQRLVVMDLDTNRAVDYCFDTASPIDWTGNGRYIFLTQRGEGFHTKVFLIDIQNAKAWRFADDVSIRTP